MISLSIDRKGDVLVGSTVYITLNDQGIPQIPFHELTFEYLISDANNPSNVHVLKRFTTSKVCVWCPRQEGEWILKAIPKLRLSDCRNKKLAISCELHVPPATLQVNVIPRIKGKIPMTFTTSNPVVCMYTIPNEGIPEDTKLLRVAFKKKPQPPKPAKKRGRGQNKNLPPKREEKGLDNVDKLDGLLDTNQLEVSDDNVENNPDKKDIKESNEVNKNNSQEEEEEEGGNEEDGEEKSEDNNEKSNERLIENDPVRTNMDNNVNRSTITSLDGKYASKRIEQTPFESQNVNSNEWTFLRSIPTSTLTADGKSVYVLVPNLEPKTVYQLKHQCFIVKSEIERQTQNNRDNNNNNNNDSNGGVDVSSSTNQNSVATTTSTNPEETVTISQPRVKKSIIELPQPIEFMTDSLKGKIPKLFVTVCPKKEILDNIIGNTDQLTGNHETGDEIENNSLIYSQILKNDTLMVSPISQSSSMGSDPVTYSLVKRKPMWSLRGDINVLINPIILDSSHDLGNLLIVSGGEKDTSMEVSTNSMRVNNSEANNLGATSPVSSGDVIGSLLSHPLTHISLTNITGVPFSTIGLKAINEQLTAIGQAHCISLGLDAKFLSSNKHEELRTANNNNNVDNTSNFNHSHHDGEIVLLCKQEHELPNELEDTLQALFSNEGGNKELNKELSSLMLQQRNIVNDGVNSPGLSSNRKSTTNTSIVIDSEGKPRKKISLISDLIIVLDRNMKLVWYWSAYDSISKGEWGSGNQLTNGTAWNNQFNQNNISNRPLFKICDPVLPSMFVEASHFPLQYGYLGMDITGATTISEAPDGSGDFIVSFMYQDSIVRIHRDMALNDIGFDTSDPSSDSSLKDGDIVWRLSPDGDFGILTESEAKKGCQPDRTLGPNSSLWWSHQQCAKAYPIYNPEENDTTSTSNIKNTCQIVILDTGAKVHEMQVNRRPNERKNGNSRGIVIDIDEKAKIATIKAEIDLGFYSNHGGDAEMIQEYNKDRKPLNSLPRYFFSGCSDIKSGGFSKKLKKNILLFVETTLMGDVLWSGRIESDVAKVMRRFSSRIGTGSGSQHMLQSPRALSNHNVDTTHTIVEVENNPHPNNSETSISIKEFCLNVEVDDVEKAVDDICRTFNLRRVENSNDSVKLVDKTMIRFTKTEGDGTDTPSPSLSVSIKYNDSIALQTIRQNIIASGRESIITGESDHENSFSCIMYNVEWNISCD